MRILLAIGALHALLIWAGDILMLYALLGFTMPWFARRTDAALLKWTVGLLAVPTALYLVVFVIALLTGSASLSITMAPPAPAEPGNGLPPDILQLLTAMGTGGVIDAFIGNLVYLVGRWMDLFVTVRFPKVLGMFVLGLWAVRQGIALDPAAHRATLVRWMRLGWAIGLPANLIGAWALSQWPYLPPSVGGLIGVVCQGIGFPLLAIGYATTITLLVVDGRRAIGVFRTGRQDGADQLPFPLRRVRRALVRIRFWLVVAHRRRPPRSAIAVAIVAVQIPLSAWWLARYQFGPCGVDLAPADLSPTARHAPRVTTCVGFSITQLPG